MLQVVLRVVVLLLLLLVVVLVAAADVVVVLVRKVVLLLPVAADAAVLRSYRIEDRKLPLRIIYATESKQCGNDIQNHTFQYQLGALK